METACAASRRGGSLPRFLLRRLATRLGEDGEAVGNHVHGVAGRTQGVVARLAHASGDPHEVAGCGLGQPVAEFAEQGNAVPVRVGLPLISVAAVVDGA